MAPLTESPIPPVPAEKREPLLISFDPERPVPGPDEFPNDLYEFVYQIALNKRKDIQATVLDRPSVRDGSCSYLVLLPRPIQAISVSTPYEITFCAAILSSVRHHGATRDSITVQGWLIATHEDAIATWKAA